VRLEFRGDPDRPDTRSVEPKACGALADPEQLCPQDCGTGDQCYEGLAPGDRPVMELDRVGRYEFHGEGLPVLILGNPQSDPRW
jgi:hypothetical protein